MQTPHPTRTAHSRCKASAFLLKVRRPKAAYGHLLPQGEKEEGTPAFANQYSGKPRGYPPRSDGGFSSGRAISRMVFSRANEGVPSSGGEDSSAKFAAPGPSSG